MSSKVVNESVSPSIRTMVETGGEKDKRYRLIIFATTGKS